MKKAEIMFKLEENKDELKKFGVEKIGLFGSYLHGKAKKESDVDLLVTLNEKGIRTFIDLWIYLDNVLKKKVDLVIEKDLFPELNYVKGEAEYVEL